MSELGLVVAVTGHRPDKLCLGRQVEWDLAGPVSDLLFAALRKAMDDLSPAEVVTGMALGVDLAWALVALERGIPVLAAIPFEGQESRWSPAQQRRYRDVLASPLVRKFVVSPGGYNPHKMQVRNEWMVDRCDFLVACFDGLPSGGTWNCVKYARRVERPIYMIDPTPWRSSA